MYQTSYHRPSSVAEAARLLASSEDAKLLAGGQTLLPTMKQRLAAPKNLIDLGKLAELKGISVSGGVVTIGAGTTHATVAASADVKGAIPALAKLASGIGDPHVRHMGTIGGSVANNDPAADYPAAVLGLGATVVTNKRSIAADDYFQGLFSTALADDEIIVKFTFPVPQKAGYAKFANPASRYAMAGVLVAKTDGRRSRRGDRRRRRRRLPLDGGGNGARRQLVAGRPRRRGGGCQPDALRPPRRQRLSRQPRQGHGQAGGHGGRLNVATAKTRRAGIRTDPRPFSFIAGSV